MPNFENPYESEGYQAPSYEDVVNYTRGFNKPKESKKKALKSSKRVKVALEKAA
jgi:hypothetical protein